MRRMLVPAVLAIGALCAGQAAAPFPVSASAAGATSSSATSERAPAMVRVPFAVSAAAFGTRASGGQLPLNSDDTAFQVMGCTNLVGQSRRNFVANQQIPGLGRAEGVTTRVWSVKSGKTVSSYSTHSIAKLVLADTPLGSLEIRGINSVSRAYNQAGKFKASTETSIGKIIAKPTGAPAQVVPIPTPDQPIEIPGLAKISIGSSTRKVTKDGAEAAANAIDIRVLPLGTRARVAHTQAAITGGVARGVFKGYSAGVVARGLDDNTKIGRLPLSLMPCQGTGGKTQGKDIAKLDLDQLVVSGVSTSQRSQRTSTAVQGFERGRVARVTLGDGRVAIGAIVGQVNVKRTSKGVTSNIKGTTVGKIVVDGQVRAIPKNKPLEIPGLVRIQDRVRTKVKNGLKVSALRITLLDGTGAVVDLGVAELAIRPGVGKRR
jgi:hypothetical protein